VPEIVAYIEKIIKNGYAYESGGSVYFDVSKFDDTPNHHYAKLVPEAYGDAKQLEDGEGEQNLSTTLKTILIFCIFSKLLYYKLLDHISMHHLALLID